MDSLTQIALGATVASSVGFKPFGRKVILVGAALGTLPDLDIFINYGNVIDNYTSHRGFSHSLFVLTLLSIAIYVLVLKFKPHFKDHKVALFGVIFLPLITHPLLDTFTTYGTQLLWPLKSAPIAWNSIFIIDPLYTLPLLMTMLFLWFSKDKKRWIKANNMALLFSCCYLLWGQVSQGIILYQVKQNIEDKESKILVMPTPFNSVYWRVIRYQEDHFFETFTHINDTKPLQWKEFKTNRSLIKEVTKLPTLDRLEWFSHGWLRFDEIEGQLQVTDLRLGFAGYHPFKFTIAVKKGEEWQSVDPVKIKSNEQQRQQLFTKLKSSVGL